jgi:hypothetical protein
MRALWKVLTVVLMAIWVACFLVNFSMYWWPDMPTSPRPEQGRIYPLNNHGSYTYMNAWDHRLNWTIWQVTPFV